MGKSLAGIAPRIALCGLALLAGCALPTRDSGDAQHLADAAAGRRIVLMGEQHDNPLHHSLRLQALRLAVRRGWRPAIAMEQFDVDRQADIDRARQERPRDADYLIARATPATDGWDWELYRPFVQFALDHELPLLAANLSRFDAAQVAMKGMPAAFDARMLAALGLDRPLPEDIVAAQQQAVMANHCGQASVRMAQGMARAQIARDATMALVVRRQAERGAVVLLAGNGHVRRDIGVARWLPADEASSALSVGLMEDGQSRPELSRRYDLLFATRAPERKDPCDELRRRGLPAMPGAR